MAVQTRIRQAEADDLPDLLALMQAYYAYDELEFDEARALAAFGDLLADKSPGCV